MKHKKTIIIITAVVLFITAAAGTAFKIFYIPPVSIVSLEPLEEAFAVSISQGENVVGYELQYSMVSDYNDETTQLIKITDTDYTAENLLGKQEYFVRARAYKTKNKITSYSKWSETSTVITKNKIPLENIIADPLSATVLTEETLKINVRLEPENTSFKVIKFTSSDPAVATVSDDGTVTGIAEGTTQICINVLETDKKAVVDITVKKPFVATTGIKITNKPDLTVETGQKLTMTAQIIPQNATNQQICWKSCDKSKATIDDKGVLTAIRPTEFLEVTASTEDGKFSAKYKLKITNSKGFLTTADLDKLNLSDVDNLMIVAHPDDETFWGGGHILNDKYLVVVLSNGFHEQRVKDFNAVIKQYGNDKGMILSYPDTARNIYDSNGKYKGYETDYWSTCKTGMEADITLLLNYKKWNTVVTHNPDGEYNKYHHKQVCQIVTDCIKNSKNSNTALYYFGHYYGANDTITDERLSDNDLDMKKQIIHMYLPTAKGAYDAFGHMLPYENWVLSSKW